MIRWIRLFGGALALVLLGTLILPNLPSVLVNASPVVIHVPQDYPTIQAAVDAANPGDSILVSASGTPYAGNITIEKSLTLIGASPSTTIINATGVGSGFIVNSTGNVVISGFTIEDFDSASQGVWVISSSNVSIIGNIIDSSLSAPGNGTFVQNSNLVVLRHNNVTGNSYGLALQGGYSNIIQSNNATGNSASDIYLGNVTGTKVTDNILRRSQSGLDIWYGSYGNTIARNTISNNSIAGIWIISSAINQIIGNNIDWNNSTSTSNGIYLQNTSNNRFYYNNLLHNSLQMFGVSGADMTGNIWNDGGVSPRGNFWSDYRGVDINGDGVGDTSLPWPCPSGGRPCSSTPPPGVDYYPLINATRPSTLNVTISASPLSGCSIPSSLHVSFTSNVRGGSSPYQYSWRFGDNSTGGNVTNPSHDYVARGQLFATLTVSDSSIPKNSAFDTASITSFPGGIVIHVRDQDGNTVSGANVTSIMQPQGLGRLYEAANSSGAVSFPCLPPGPYEFSIRLSGYQSLLQPVTVMNGLVTQTFTIVKIQSSFSLNLLDYLGIAAAFGVILVGVGFFWRRARRKRMSTNTSASPKTG